ncbi:MAG: lipid A export permease/ATP-binding protein MsbA [Alphaproteobacteria bacterium]|nr:lipid A export permease/ATP-binding protein MsbA [Alphaproteobacteria bacterium]
MRSGTWRRLIHEHVRVYWRRIALGIGGMVVAAAATAANAWIMEPVLDWIFTTRDRRMLWLIPLGVVAIAIVKSIATYVQAAVMNEVGQRIIADLQRRLFAHLIQADLQFFHDNPTGRLISRFTNDVQMLRGAIANSLTGIVKDAATAAFLVALMFYQNWRLALIAFVVLPIALIPARKLGRRMKKVSAGSQEQTGALAAMLDETFQGARHVKAYGMESYETRRAGEVVEGLYALNVKAAQTRAASHPIMEALASLAIAGVILYGGHAVLAGTTTPGAFFSFITALLLAYQPIRSLSNLNVTLNEGTAAAERVYAMLDSPPSIRDRAGATALPAVKGEIRFEHVGFAYPDGSAVLEDFDLHVPAGRTVALVGASGAGKSTVLNLIPRFYDVSAGRVTIDGQDVRDVTLASLRGAIAIVSQELTLFHDTVRANIAYGRPGAGPAEIAHAAELAGAAGFIAELPHGYDTVVGERGAKLSGGQRQRVAIARAILKDAPILLLDEATSALDMESERHVQAALAQLKRNRTTLVVAHRLSTVVDADEICVVQGGRVIERGRHADLLARGGAYARLYAAQAAEAPDAVGGSGAPDAARVGA